MHGQMDDFPITICFVLLCLHNQTTICLADLTTVPKNTVILMGENTSLACITNSSDHLEWEVKKTGRETVETVYNGLYLYFDEGRHKMNINEALGQYNLSIENIQPGDAGTYTCFEGGSKKQEFSAELTIIYSNPICEHNSSLDRVVVENVCGIEPDTINFTCSVTYRGKLAPVLEWRSSDGGLQTKGVPEQTPSNRLSIHMSLKGSSDMEGKHYTCSVVNGSSSTKCTTGNIHTVYLRKPQLPGYQQIRKGDQSNSNVTCRANTNQVCTYSWISFIPSTDITDKFEIPGATIRGADVDPGLYRCTAKCKILDKECTVEPMVLEVLENEIHGKTCVDNIEKVLGQTFTNKNLSISILVILIIWIIIWIVLKKLSRLKKWLSDKQQVSKDHSRLNEFCMDFILCVSGVTSGPEQTSSSQSNTIRQPEAALAENEALEPLSKSQNRDSASIQGFK